MTPHGEFVPTEWTIEMKAQDSELGARSLRTLVVSLSSIVLTVTPSWPAGSEREMCDDATERSKTSGGNAR